MKRARHAARRAGPPGLVYGGLAASLAVLGAVLAGWSMSWPLQAALAGVVALQFATIARLRRRPRTLVFCPNRDHEHR